VGTELYVADVLRDVRHQFYETGDPTFLAYAFFGDANLRVAVPAQAQPRPIPSPAARKTLVPTKTEAPRGEGTTTCRRYAQCVDALGFGSDGMLHSEPYVQAKCGSRPSQC